MTETHRVRDLARLVAEITGATVEMVSNPRNEADENELFVENRRLLNLGLEPITLSEGLLREVTEIARAYAPRADLARDHLRSLWRPQARRCQAIPCTAGEGFAPAGPDPGMIGAQNAFVLRQGLLRRHVLLVSSLCALSVALLIAAGVAGASAFWCSAGRRCRGSWPGWVPCFSAGTASPACARPAHPRPLAASSEGAAGSAKRRSPACAWLNPRLSRHGRAAGRHRQPLRQNIAPLRPGSGSGLVPVFFALGCGARLLALPCSRARPPGACSTSPSACSCWHSPPASCSGTGA
ncbi:MAG: hypothetical protein U1E17_04930 [Geminicoccaceae bacterium]